MPTKGKAFVEAVQDHYEERYRIKLTRSDIPFVVNHPLLQATRLDLAIRPLR
jgi:hypothetical protein